MIAIAAHAVPVQPQLLFLALNLVWAAHEVWLGLRRRAADGGARDAGTLGLLWRVLMLGIFAAVGVTLTGYGHLPASWHVPMRWAGCALIASGLVLRIWSIHVLARFFTVDVSVQQGHELVRRGPYRWIRHPSYTGALLCFLGLGVGLGNALALPLLLVPVGFAFARRIRVEEQALREAFPQAYAAYAAQTGRLLPWRLV
ncbi:isoprenylcysteine carboxylmethyltransferase family protein [Stenotrophomonas sp. HITSZ_GD]|uniref:methyltransferase family protein n=1 Tax=Stenotrophomonas sp. HITSZ_GD TaxID=3037248 RepID=UPI00240D302D|nr:isoprenylcysteine carboxylmethyltransferase family protein [Stenotrophomonas sp. HITSZ_GD]MDG2523994.1 isoprenylcysteine carboxylmethyltransferase family protein [Stenotrophomonas sp. HITSZ_GD]